MTPFIAQIFLLGFNFNPKTWALCSGQLMAINQNAALFSILGTTYGGNGTTTFALPDLRGRIPVHTGQGPGTSNIVLGEIGGSQTTQLLANNLPLHSHTMSVSTTAGNAGTPSVNLLAQGPTVGSPVTLYSTATPNTTMAATALASNGSNVAISILQPYLTLNYSMALQGIFPSRS